MFLDNAILVRSFVQNQLTILIAGSLVTHTVLFRGSSNLVGEQATSNQPFTACVRDDAAWFRCRACWHSIFGMQNQGAAYVLVTLETWWAMSVFPSVTWLTIALAAQVVCTLGPKSRSVEVCEELLRAGMGVARFNFSHGSHEYHQVRPLGQMMRQQSAATSCLNMCMGQCPSARRVACVGTAVSLLPASQQPCCNCIEGAAIAGAGGLITQGKDTTLFWPCYRRFPAAAVAWLCSSQRLSAAHVPVPAICFENCRRT